MEGTCMSKLTLATRLGAAAAAALLLAGCTAAGGGASSSATASPSAVEPVVAAPDPDHADPCSLLQPADFTEWGNIPEMSEGRFIASLSGSGRSICRWTPASDDISLPRVQVVLSWDYTDIDERRQLADEIGAGTEDIEIVGATSAYSAYGGRTLAMTTGEYFVQVSFTLPGVKTSTVRAANVYFTELALTRLG